MALETQARCGAAEYGNVARANFVQIEARLVVLETVAGGGIGPLVSSYASLTAAVAALGATPTTLIIDQATTVPSNTIVPATMTLFPLVSGVITVAAGVTLTVKGNITAGEAQQVFDVTAAGSAVKGDIDSAVTVVRPEWFGAAPDGNIDADFTLATAHDDTAGVKAAFGFFQDRATDSGGVVLLRARTYKVTEALTLLDSVKVLGEGGGRRHGHQQGTLLAFRPAGSSDFIDLAPGAGVGAEYAFCSLENVTIVGDRANAQVGLHIKTARSYLKNVVIRDFVDTLLHVEYPVDSRFEFVSLLGSGFCTRTLRLTGLLADGSVGTTSTWTDCYFSGANGTDGHASLEIATQTDVTFIRPIFESNLGNVLLLDDIFLAQFLHVYLEGNYGHNFKVGATTLVRKLIVDGAIAQNPALDGLCAATDYFNLDRVYAADIDLSYVGSGAKAALVRKTSNTGRVRVKSAAYDTSIATTANARANSTDYVVGDRIQVTEDNSWATPPRTLVFVCTTAGKTAGAQPAVYVWGAANVTDGTAKFSQVATVASAFDTVAIEDDTTPTAANDFSADRLPASVYRSSIGATAWHCGVLFGDHPEEFQLKERSSGIDNPIVRAYPSGDASAAQAGRIVIAGAASGYSASHRVQIGKEVEIVGDVGLDNLLADPAVTVGVVRLYAKAGELWVIQPDGTTKKIALVP